MINGHAIPKTFRAMMQRLSLARIKHSPKRQIEQAAVNNAKKTAAAATAAQPHGGSSSNPTDATTAASEDVLVSKFLLPAAVTEHLRHKSREAIKMATEKASALLESAVDNAKHSTASAYFSKAAHLDHETAYSRLQKALREGRKDYYSRTPFDQRWDDITKSLSVLGRVSTGNTVTPFRDSGEAFEAMWKAVDGGRHEVMWQTYICKDDYVGQTTVHKMAIAKMERKCTTELLYDCGGNIGGRTRLTERLSQSGATVIPYRPFFHSFAEYIFKGFDWKISPGLRNHRKILLVDKEIGFCGGLNIGNEYCGPQTGGTGKFRDTHCSVVGPAVAHLREVYDDTKEPRPWKFSPARWRQIAAKQWNRQYVSGKFTVDKKVIERLQSTTRAVTERGGVYFSRQLGRAEANTSRVLDRMRWRKQANRREAYVRWNDRNNGNGVSEAVAKAARLEDSEAAATNTDISSTINPEQSETAPAPAPAAETTTAAATAAPTSVPAGDADPSSYHSAQPNGNRTGVMRRKLMEARVRALSNATDLPHKRSYTSLLQQLPIRDDEAVPEAEMYCLRRQPITQIVSCNPRYRDYSIQYAFWQVTRKCHRRIWITTPYYLPTKKLFRALLHAASRGVDVRILAGSAQTTDPWFMWHASNYITARLLRSGVKIYEYKGSQIMHAKTVVADSVWCSIGSYNWDVMSNKNLEVCLCQLSLETARDMERQFLQDLAASEEVRLEDHEQRSRWLRLTSWLFYNFVFVLDRITFRSFSNQDLVDSAGDHED